MIEEDRLLRALARKMIRSCPSYTDSRSRVRPWAVDSLLRQIKGFGVGDTTFDDARCVPIELAGKLDELVTTSGMYFVRAEVWAANA
jgi:hypothetical protein